jgi:hypothetical protein
MANGLLQLKNNAQLAAEKEAIADADFEVYESQLSSHIQRSWERNRRAKEQHDLELLKCMRQRNGEYEPDTYQKIVNQGGSKIYMMLTATKIRAAVSWISDVLTSLGDKTWTLDPTPKPDLPPNLTSKIIERIAQTIPAEEPEEGMEAHVRERATAMRDDMLGAVKEMAKEAAERMEITIDDQMVEGAWDRAMEDFIEDFCTFPTAIIKGPIIRKRPKLNWDEQGNANAADEIVLEFGRVSSFDAYPAPMAGNANEGDFIERIQFERSDLHGWIGSPGYNEEAIREVLTEHGRNGLRDWLWADYERFQLEGKDKFFLQNGDDSIDGIHFFGSVQGVVLLEWGMDKSKVPDPLAEYDIDAIKVGRHIIRAVINSDPLNRRPYHTASFQKVPDGFWGIAIPRLMRDHQNMCNATARALANNLGIASGPIMQVQMDRLAEGQQVEQIYPWMILQTKSDKMGKNSQAIDFFQARSNAQELLGVYEEFERKADDATGIPRYSYGNERVGGAGQTASGLSMLMSNATKNIKMAIASIDSNIIKPVIEMTFAFNMMYNNDPSIKGDVKVRARGAAALLVKESVKAKRAEFLMATGNEIDMQIVGIEGRAEILRANAGDLDLEVKRIVPEREELAKRIQMQAEAQAQQPPDPKLQELEMKAQVEAQKAEREEAQFKERLAINTRAEQERMTMADNLAKEKQQREYELKLRLIEEESNQRELDRDIDRDADAQDRQDKMAIERERVQLANDSMERTAIPPEPKETQPVQQAPAPVIVNVGGESEKDENGKAVLTERETQSDAAMDSLKSQLSTLQSDEKAEEAARKGRQDMITKYLRQKSDDPKLNTLLNRLEGSN